MEDKKMVVSSFNSFVIDFVTFDLVFNHNSCSDICLSIGLSGHMIKKLKYMNSKIKDLSTHLLTTLTVWVVYWIGIPISYFLWRLSRLKEKNKTETYWQEVEEDKNFTSQY